MKKNLLRLFVALFLLGFPDFSLAEVNTWWGNSTCKVMQVPAGEFVGQDIFDYFTDTGAPVTTGENYIDFWEQNCGFLVCVDRYMPISHYPGGNRTNTHYLPNVTVGIFPVFYHYMFGYVGAMNGLVSLYYGWNNGFSEAFLLEIQSQMAAEGVKFVEAGNLPNPNTCIVCDLAINNFNVSKNTINPLAGDQITISANITTSSSEPISWQWTVSGDDATAQQTRAFTESGSGTVVDIVWDGKDGDLEVFGPGTYNAELTAWEDTNNNGIRDTGEDCLDTITHTIIIEPPPKFKCISVPWSSSANVANGNISHNQHLLSTNGAGITTNVTLHYNSFDGLSGPLGRGWSHSYEILLREGSNGEVVARFGMDNQRLYTPDGSGGYTPSVGDYSNLAQNGDNTFTINEKDGTLFNFNIDGNLSTVVDRNGNTQTFSYTNNLLTSITDSTGRITTFSYDLSNYLTAITDPGGNTYQFDITGNTLNSVTNPDGGQWLYTYNPNGLFLSKADPEGNAVTYTYDSKGRALTTTDAEGRVRSITYPTEEGDVKTSLFTDKDGSVRQITYEVQTGNRLGVTSPLGDSTSKTYDDNRNPLSATDEAGRTTTYTYDTNGNRTSVTDPLGQTTTYTYNGFGQATSIADVEGKTTNYVYDVNGNLTSMTDQAGNTIQYQYDSAGKLTSSTNPLLQIMTIIYDVNGNIESVTDYSGAVTTFTYDALGNRASQTDALGNTTTFIYDFRSNMVSMTDALGNVTTFTYDYNGNRTSQTDANGNVTNFDFNSQDQVIEVEDPLGNLTQYNYGSTSGCSSCSSGVDKLKSLTDANGNVTSFSYDVLGRLTKEIDSLGNETNYTYDTIGNLTSRTDANGVTVQYSYDTLDRLILIDYPTDADISYTYDESTNGFGRLTGITDETGTTAYSYDPVGNLIQEDKVIDGITYSTVYQYDSAYNLVSTIYPSGRAVSYTRDTAGRVISVESCMDAACQTLTDNIQYLSVGPLSNLTYGNGIELINTYDTLNRLSSVQADPVYHRTYSYDPLSNIVSINNSIEPAASQSYTYDAVSRLIEAIGGYYGTISYSYDPVGNRLTKSDDGQTDTYSYVSGSNQLASISGQTQESFTYDANGNPTTYAEKSLTFNQNNRLIEARLNSEVAGSYLYNANGQRVKKDAAGEITVSSYDQSGNLIAESNEQGKVLREYIYLYGERLTQYAYAPTDITVQVSTSRNGPLANAKVYAFTETGSYTGLYGVTNENGIASFSRDDLTDGYYKFRIDYLSSQFWSDVIVVPGTNLVPVAIEDEPTEVTVTAAGELREGIKVYLFSDTGTYLGLYQTTDANGLVTFDLPVGESYKFRADYLSSQYWSNVTTIAAGGVNLVPMDIGGGTLTATVQKAAAQPLAGVKVYLFSQSGAYLGINATTDANGQVGFQISGGDYKLRVDYLGYQFWSDIASVSIDADIIVDIPHQDKTITVTGLNDTDSQPRNARVYLFTAAGSYLGQYQDTDASGQVVFNLPNMDYKVRADYLSQQFWSAVFNGTDQSIIIPEGLAEVTVTNSGQPVAGVIVYVFTGTGTYLNINETSNEQGKVSFLLPQGEYNFRADYLGYQFWTNVIAIPGSLSESLTIPHQDVTVTVNETFNPDVTPISGVKTYLFSGAGSYMGINATSDANGQVTFNLPEKEYKFRSDFMSSQYWSDTVTWQDFAININHGQADVHVTMSGADLGNVPVYLFTETGSYLGRMTKTDIAGLSSFLIPAKAYKFRADYNGTQYWSDVINVLGDELTTVEMALDLLAINETNNPHPSRYDGETPERRIQVANAGPTILAEPLYPTAEVYYYINDHLGTPQVVMDVFGDVVWKANQEPFGEVSADVETVENNFRFPGQYFDSETGLHYNWNRYYDPATGRYLTPDPIGLAGGLNLYKYAGANPVNMIDPEGLWVVPAIIWGVRIIKVGVGIYGFYKTYEYLDKASNVVDEKIDKENQLENEFNMGIPDSSKAEHLSIEINELNKEGLSNLLEATKHTTNIPGVSTSCP
ncbi:MAG: RHS repeat-associated core domain-containing protein [bacterium]